LVHAFSFNLGEKELYFLWDIESGSLLRVDYEAFCCAKKRYANISKESKKASAPLSESEKIFLTLEKEGILNAPQKISAFKKEYKYLKALCLHISNDCNMRCDYCFADNYVAKGADMSVETGKRAIDYLIANSGSKKNLEVDFFGGEPLLNFGAVKEIITYAKEAGKLNDKEFLFTLTTNCLLLDNDAQDYLNKELDNVVLSLDGRESVNNACRRSLGGKPVYDKIVKNILEFIKKRGEKSYYVRGTITAKNPDFASDILHIADLGINQISLEPVVLNNSHPLAVKEEHIAPMCLEYERLAREMLKRRKEGNGFNFFHFMIDLEHGPCLNKRLTGCGAGTEYLAVAPNGNLYPCHRFLDNENFLLGNVFNDFNFSSPKALALKETFASLSVHSKPYCKNCPAKYYCGGGCVANSLEFSGELEGEYKVGCELLKKRLEIALALESLRNE